MTPLKDRTAIQTHINILQNIIARMANNSVNCKTWVITVVSAILVLLIDKNKTDYYYIAYVPLVMLYILDCYYLGLEKHFRKQYNQFIDKVNSSSIDEQSIYKIAVNECFLCSIFTGLLSFSTTPVYLILGILLYIVSTI